MHLIVAQQPGPPDVLQVAEAPIPEPGPGQLLVRTAATGVNFIETYQRSGLYPVPFPFTPGAEAAGTIESLGPDVTGFTAGDRIATTEASACYAEYFLVDSDKALPFPSVSDTSPELDVETAAALPLQGMTAHYLANSSSNPSAGETALVHAGAGGVGLLLIQLLQAKGVTVFTTVSTPEKAALAQAAGAAHILDYQDFATQIRELTQGRGVDVVYDGVGQATFDGSLDSVALRGKLILFGGASGPVPPFDLQRLNAAGSITLSRPSLYDFLHTPEERRWRWQELITAVIAGELSVRIGARYSLAEAAQAHNDLQSRRTTGKLLLIP